MMIRNYGTGGLKAQKLIAQGIALGLVSEFVRPERAKALIFRALLELLPLQGEYTNCLIHRALPYAMCRPCPFRAHVGMMRIIISNISISIIAMRIYFNMTLFKVSFNFNFSITKG